MKPKVLFIEGGDSVGKNELVRSVVKYLLVTQPTKKIVLMNFPQYWFFGHDIRLTMRGTCDDMFEGYSGAQHAATRISLYSLDRNIALLLVEKLVEQYGDELIIVSDRGPYSSCVTLGYLSASNVVAEGDLDGELVPALFEKSDQGMLEYFDSVSLLCAVEGGVKNTALGKRKALDKYESEQPQVHAYKIYDMLKLPTIFTKTADGWRDRFELAKEATAHLKSLTSPTAHRDETTDIMAFNDPNVLITAEKEGKLILVGPKLFLKHFSAWHKADKSLKLLISQWTQLSLTSDDIRGKNRKEILDTLETKIALKVKNMTSLFEYYAFKKDSCAINAIKQLLLAHPEIMDIVSKTTAKHRMTIFFNGMLVPEQLKLPLTYAVSQA